MKILLVCVVFLFAAEQVTGQNFVKQTKLDMPDSLQKGTVLWGDMNNDGLLDVIVNASTSSDSAYVTFIQTDTINGSFVKSIIPIHSDEIISLTDYNRDNMIDVLMSGSGLNDSTRVLLNKGEFVFEEYGVHENSFPVSRFADLDNDGWIEWIVNVPTDSGTYVKIMNYAHDRWDYREGGWKLTTTDIEVLPSDGDGFTDVFLSGYIDTDSLFTGVLRGDGNCNFSVSSKQGLSGDGTASDLNGDGLLDIHFTGVDNQGALVEQKWINQADTFAITSQMMIYHSIVATFIADFNSNGIPDVNYHARTALGDTINIIQYDHMATNFVLPHRWMTMQQFGDYEHDGDLDVVQLTFEDDTLRLVYYLNDAGKNQAPVLSGSPVIAMGLFKHVFLFWNGATDDHTPRESITYDLGFKNQVGDILAANFDLLNASRLVPRSGNNGTQHFKLLKNVSFQDFSWAVQAVDNALHSGITGTCIGKSLPCSESEFTKRNVSACDGEAVVLQTQQTSYWFSFRDGFLGEKTSHELIATKPDTLFYFDPSTPSCGGITMFLVNIVNKPRTVKMPDVVGCQHSVIEFKAEDGWTVQWSSTLHGVLGNTSILDYALVENDSVFSLMNNGKGCSLLRKTAVKISTPAVVASDDMKIMKGDYASLNVSGAEIYQWSPTSGLDNPSSSQPVASPKSTTTYRVTGIDSLGCSAVDSVTVFVENTGFIPSLFTPNGDAVNDELKVFGVSTTQDFSFKIYNREGNILFQTQNVAVAQEGWDGKYKGVIQPDGVYYWKVSGRLPNGGKVLLNGKDAGSVVLLR